MPHWSQTAEESLQRNIEYYAKEDPMTAYRIFDAVLEGAEVLDDHHNIGRVGRIKGTRELVINGTPFILVYQCNPNEIVILNLLHGAQKWP